MPKYNWEATYADGFKVPQYNADGSENAYTDLRHELLTSFALYAMLGDEKLEKVFELHLDPGQRLIFRKRVWMYSTPDGGGQDFVYMIGWQQKQHHRGVYSCNGYEKNCECPNVQAIAYVFSDGHVELAGKFREGHPVFDPPKKSVKETHLEDWPGCKS